MNDINDYMTAVEDAAAVLKGIRNSLINDGWPEDTAADAVVEFLRAARHQQDGEG